MARVEAFAVPGVRMLFYSGDHRPPHFHARRRGRWHARVYIQAPAGEMIELVGPRDARISAADRRAIVCGVETNRGELLREWEKCQSGP